MAPERDPSAQAGPSEPPRSDVDGADVLTVDGAPPTSEADRTITVDLAWQSVVVGLLALVGLVLLWIAVRSASTAFTLIVVSLFLAMALDPVVGAIARTVKVSRGWATVLVLVAVAVLMGLFMSIAGPQLVQESATLEKQLPKTVRSLNDLPLVGDSIRDADLSSKLTDALAALPEKTNKEGANVGGLVAKVSFGLGAFLMGFFLVAGGLFEGPRLIGDIRTAIPPARRAAADAIGRIIYRVLAKYFAGSLLIAILNGMWVAVSALIVGVPLSPILGVWAALTSLIPQIGGLMGFALVFIVSLTEGVGATIFMSIAFLAFMLLNNHVLVPTVVGRAVSLSAPVTMLAAIGGFSVAGVVGAVLAVPTFGAIKAVVVHMRGDDPEPDAAPKHPGMVTRLRARFGHHDRPATVDPPA